MLAKLKEKPFWVHILIILLIVVILVFGVLQLLGLITQHGKYLTVPAVAGKKTEEAIKILEGKGFEVVITDSVYTDTAAKGTVLKQFPDPNSTVKVNRAVLLTVNRTTLPLLEMPLLQGKSLGYAMEILKRSHLLLGDTSFRADFMLGSVLEQRYKGSIINSGDKVPWGSRIDLVIGGGLSVEEIIVPDLTSGMTFAQAKAILDSAGIMLGSIVADGVTDTMNAYVNKQIPPRFTKERRPVYIRGGQVMDLWLGREYKPIIDSVDVINSNNNSDL